LHESKRTRRKSSAACTAIEIICTKAASKSHESRADSPGFPADLQNFPADLPVFMQGSPDFPEDLPGFLADLPDFPVD
jgi:hypothetical protein